MPFLNERLIRKILDISKDSDGYAVIPYVKRSPSVSNPPVSPFAKGGLEGDLKGEGEKIKFPYSQFGLQPLCAVYPKKVLPKIEKALNKGNLAIRNFLEDCDCKYVCISSKEQHAFYNINTPEELTHCKSLLSYP